MEAPGQEVAGWEETGGRETGEGEGGSHQGLLGLWRHWARPGQTVRRVSDLGLGRHQEELPQALGHVLPLGQVDRQHHLLGLGLLTLHLQHRAHQLHHHHHHHHHHQQQ